MDTPLILDSVEISGYRGFRHLRIERLGRVNLLVGKNNVGKSSLLEALWLYAHQGSASVVWQVLEWRDEGERPMQGPDGRSEAHERWLALKHLFNGRTDIRRNAHEIRIGPIGTQQSQTDVLSIAIEQRHERIGVNGELVLEPLKSEERKSTEDEILVVSIRMGSAYSASYRLDRPIVSYFLAPLWRCVFTAANGLDAKQVAQFWDGIALTNLEEDVLKSLQIIAPEVERVSLVSSTQMVRLPIAFLLPRLQILTTLFPSAASGRASTAFLA